MKVFVGMIQKRPLQRKQDTAETPIFKELVTIVRQTFRDDY